MLPVLRASVSEWLKELLHKMEPIMTKEFAEFALIRRPKELGNLRFLLRI